MARQYTGTLGKVANCQVAVSVHGATDAASAVLDWRLSVPQSWDDTCLPDPDGPDGTVVNEHARRLREQPDTTVDEAGARKPYVRKKLPLAEQIGDIRGRRAASKMPDTERYRPKWVMALEMLDELASWGLTPPVLTADAGYGQVAEFRQGLTDRDIRYIVATTSTTTAQPGDAVPVAPEYAGIGKHPTPRYRDPVRTLKQLALDQVTEHGRQVAPMPPGPSPLAPPTHPTRTRTQPPRHDQVTKCGCRTRRRCWSVGRPTASRDRPGAPATGHGSVPRNCGGIGSERTDGDLM